MSQFDMQPMDGMIFLPRRNLKRRPTGAITNLTRPKNAARLPLQRPERTDPVSRIANTGLNALNQGAAALQRVPGLVQGAAGAAQVLAQPTPTMDFNLARVQQENALQQSLAQNPNPYPQMSREQVVASMNPSQRNQLTAAQGATRDAQMQSQFARQDIADMQNRMGLARQIQNGAQINAGALNPAQAQQLSRAGANLDFSAFRTPGVRAPGRGFAGGGLVSQPFNQATLAPSTETAEQLAARRQAIRDYRSTVRPQDRGRVSFGDFRRQQAQDQLRMDLARQQARPDPVTVAAGESVVDPNTGRVVFQAPAQPRDTRPVTVSPGQSVVNPNTGEVVFQAPAGSEQMSPLEQARIREIDARIANMRAGLTPSQKARVGALSQAMRNAWQEEDRASIMQQIEGILNESQQQNTPQGNEPVVVNSEEEALSLPVGTMVTLNGQTFRVEE